MSGDPSTPDRVAIDGPAASGKTTVGKMLANRWGYRFLDTGIMYRCVTLIAIKRGIDIADDVGLGQLASSLEFGLRIGSKGDNELLVTGAPISEDVGSDEVTAAVSAVSAVGAVRDALVAAQRELGKAGAIVMAGRDIGTVVMPDAPLKVYLDASVSARAQRRIDEMRTRGESVACQDIKDAIERRDAYDSSRSHSPLMRATDAILINTDGLTPEQVVGRIVQAHSSAFRSVAA